MSASNRDRLGDIMPDCRQARNILRQVALINDDLPFPDRDVGEIIILNDDQAAGTLLEPGDPVLNQSNQDWYIDWIIHRLTKPNLNGGISNIDGVRRAMMGPQRFLTALGDTPLHRVQPIEVTGTWLRALTEPNRDPRRKDNRPLSPTTLNKCRLVTRAFLRFCFTRSRANQLCSGKLDDEMRGDIREHLLDWNKLHILLRRLRRTNRALLIIMLYTGLELHEILNLKVDDIVYDQPVTLVRAYWPDETERMVGVYEHGDFLRHYVDLIRQHNPHQVLLFPKKGTNDEPISEPVIWERISRWGKKCGLTGLCFKRLRHTFIMYMLARRDVGEDYLMHAMGIKRPESIRELAEDVNQLLAKGYTFNGATAQEPEAVPGTIPCIICGHEDNPITPDANNCRSCGQNLPVGGNTPQTRAVARLARTSRDLGQFLGQTADDRAALALHYITKESKHD